VTSCSKAFGGLFGRPSRKAPTVGNQSFADADKGTWSPWTSREGLAKHAECTQSHTQLGIVIGCVVCLCVVPVGLRRRLEELDGSDVNRAISHRTRKSSPNGRGSIGIGLGLQYDLGSSLVTSGSPLSHEVGLVGHNVV